MGQSWISISLWREFDFREMKIEVVGAINVGRTGEKGGNSDNEQGGHQDCQEQEAQVETGRTRVVLFGFGTSLFFFLFFRNNHFGTKVKQACSTAWVVSLLQPVWTTKNHHLISVNQFPSLITRHSFFHTHLATSLLFSSLNFFTLFMGLTPVNRYSVFFLFFFFQYPTHRS